jgi:hypothetical protein
MAKVRKKPKRIVNVSPRRGMADMRADIRTLRPLILDMVLRGLITLKALNPDTLNPPPSSSYVADVAAIGSSLLPPTDIKLVTTMTKSRMFHESFKYEFLPSIKPKPIILRTISPVYRIRKTLSASSKNYGGFVSKG